jgi:hypothetical protein
MIISQKETASEDAFIIGKNKLGSNTIWKRYDDPDAPADTPIGTYWSYDERTKAHDINVFVIEGEPNQFPLDILNAAVANRIKLSTPPPLASQVDGWVYDIVSDHATGMLNSGVDGSRAASTIENSTWSRVATRIVSNLYGPYVQTLIGEDEDFIFIRKEMPDYIGGWTGGKAAGKKLTKFMVRPNGRRGEPKLSDSGWERLDQFEVGNVHRGMIADTIPATQIGRYNSHNMNALPTTSFMNEDYYRFPKSKLGMALEGVRNTDGPAKLILAWDAEDHGLAGQMMGNLSSNGGSVYMTNAARGYRSALVSTSWTSHGLSRSTSYLGKPALLLPNNFAPSSRDIPGSKAGRNVTIHKGAMLEKVVIYPTAAAIQNGSMTQTASYDMIGLQPNPRFWIGDGNRHIMGVYSSSGLTITKMPEDWAKIDLYYLKLVHS